MRDCNSRNENFSSSDITWKPGGKARNNNLSILKSGVSFSPFGIIFLTTFSNEINPYIYTYKAKRLHSLSTSLLWYLNLLNAGFCLFRRIKRHLIQTFTVLLNLAFLTLL